MTPLGNIRAGVRKIANKAASLTYRNGQVALFVGSNGETAAVLWYEPGYEHAVSHRHDLVGVYRHHPSPAPIAKCVRDDLLSMMGEAA